jgi:hypothetical protein
MATEPVVIVFQAAVVRRYGPAGSTLLADYWALTKPGVNFLIVITTFSGFYLGCAAGWHDFPFVRAINLVIGTLLVASGTGTLNQYLEPRFDTQMQRTARRALASGRLKTSAVLRFGIALSVLRSVYLAVAVNVLASLLALATLLSYSPGLHSAHTKDSAVHSGRGVPQRHAAPDWLGCSMRQASTRGLGTLRGALLMALSTFHGDRLDVSRGLRPRRLPGAPS